MFNSSTRTHRQATALYRGTVVLLVLSFAGFATLLITHAASARAAVLPARACATVICVGASPADSGSGSIGAVGSK